MYFCVGINCSVYFYGSSSGGICPECKNEGVTLTERQKAKLLTISHQIK